jgi:hypothetical protein
VLNVPLNPKNASRETANRKKSGWIDLLATEKRKYDGFAMRIPRVQCPRRRRGIFIEIGPLYHPRRRSGRFPAAAAPRSFPFWAGLKNAA